MNTAAVRGWVDKLTTLLARLPLDERIKVLRSATLACERELEESKAPLPFPKPVTMKRAKADAIAKALRAEGTILGAARTLGIGRATLYRLLNEGILEHATSTSDRYLLLGTDLGVRISSRRAKG